VSGSEVTVKEGRKEGTSIEAFEVRKVVRRSSFVVRWFVRWFVGSFVGSLVGWFVGWLVGSFARLFVVGRFRMFDGEECLKPALVGWLEVEGFLPSAVVVTD